jgi:HNH endonuclease
MRSCIICGKNAASREHVFPAALGGRRTNKGIYCSKHNNAFSKHASIISEQLRHFNALLAIRPDHSKSAKPYNYTLENGEQVSTFNGETRRINAPTTQGPDLLNVTLELGELFPVSAYGFK